MALMNDYRSDSCVHYFYARSYYHQFKSRMFTAASHEYVCDMVPITN